jgi:hypothetical protein
VNGSVPVTKKETFIREPHDARSHKSQCYVHESPPKCVSIASLFPDRHAESLKHSRTACSYFALNPDKCRVRSESLNPRHRGRDIRQAVRAFSQGWWVTDLEIPLVAGFVSKNICSQKFNVSPSDNSLRVNDVNNICFTCTRNCCIS